MRNIPFFSLLPRIIWLVLFAAATNYATLSNYPVKAEKWVTTYHEAWVRDATGEWAHNVEELHVLQPAKTLFELCGAALYVPAIFSLLALCVLAVLHLIFRETLDNYIHTGAFVAEWKAAPPALRLWATVVLMSVLFVGGALVAAGVGK